MHMNRMEREDHLYKAFEYFDKDKSGYSTFDLSFVLVINNVLITAV